MAQISQKISYRYIFQTLSCLSRHFLTIFTPWTDSVNFCWEFFWTMSTECPKLQKNLRSFWTSRVLVLREKCISWIWDLVLERNLAKVPRYGEERNKNGPVLLLVRLDFLADAMQRKATDINGDFFRRHCKDPRIKQPGFHGSGVFRFGSIQIWKSHCLKTHQFPIP